MSKGKGFSGTIKRHDFRRGPETHGSDSHRQPGSIGAGTYPGKVFKGTGMAGHMGNDRVTVKKLTVVRTDAARNLLLIKGAVPGARNAHGHGQEGQVDAQHDPLLQGRQGASAPSICPRSCSRRRSTRPSCTRP